MRFFTAVSSPRKRRSTTRVRPSPSVSGRIPFWRCRGTSPPTDLHVQRRSHARCRSAIRRLAVRSGGADRRLRVAPRCGRSVGRRVPPAHPCRARGVWNSKSHSAFSLAASRFARRERGRIPAERSTPLAAIRSPAAAVGFSHAASRFRSLRRTRGPLTIRVAGFGGRSGSHLAWRSDLRPRCREGRALRRRNGLKSGKLLI